MNLSKNNIIKNLTKKSSLPFLEGSMLLESFLLLIKSKALSKSVKKFSSKSSSGFVDTGSLGFLPSKQAFLISSQGVASSKLN